MIGFEFGECGTLRVLTLSEGELVIRPLQADEKYVAISHTWGDSTNTIEGIGWTVASWISLESCRALVEVYNNVWIDSLCIKQEPSDEPDKSAQIKNMHNIYGNAKDVVVVLTGKFIEQLDAIHRLTQLFKELKPLLLEGECTSTPDCPYIQSFQEIREAAIIVRRMQWFRRVWTLQEAIIPESLSFVGIEGGKMVCDVATKEDFQNLIQAFEDVDPDVWVEGELHLCSMFIPDSPQNLWNVDVTAIIDSMRPVNLQWFKYMKGQDWTRSLKDTADTVLAQLGCHNRDCKFMNDRVYAVCVILGIEIESADYHRQFDTVFLEAVQKIVKHGICALPGRPQVTHGETWLPSLEHIDLKDAWRTVETRASRGERRSDLYHNIVCKEGDDAVYAVGCLIQIFLPYKLLRTNMESIQQTLQAIVKAACDQKRVDVCSIQDPVLRTFTCVVLWLFANRGGDTSIDGVTIWDVESLILLVYKYSDALHMENGESSRTVDMHISNIMDGVWIPVSTSITSKLDEEKWTVFQVVTWILEETFLVGGARNVYRGVLEDTTSKDSARAFRSSQLCECDAMLVAKKNFGLVLYSVPSSVYETRQTYNSYGLFYDPKEREHIQAQTFVSNILGEVDDGIWDNHGMAQFWYVADVTTQIVDKRIHVGTLH
jgi:hypothetical protein